MRRRRGRFGRNRRWQKLRRCGRTSGEGISRGRGRSGGICVLYTMVCCGRDCAVFQRWSTLSHKGPIFLLIVVSFRPFYLSEAQKPSIIWLLFSFVSQLRCFHCSVLFVVAVFALIFVCWFL
ncbi:hypothetical protein HDV57DRAFT_243599 [Trichoderma longibrachiatum]